MDESISSDERSFDSIINNSNTNNNSVNNSNIAEGEIPKATPKRVIITDGESKPVMLTAERARVCGYDHSHVLMLL